MGYGMLGHIGIAKEPAWGSATAATDYLEALSENVAVSIDRFDVKNIIGRLSEPDDEAGIRRIEGDITIPAHPVVMGYFLNGVTGIQSTTVVLSGVLWSNKFQMATADNGTDNAVPPYTLEIYRDVTSAHQISGAQISKLELNIQPNQDLRMTASFIGKAHAHIAKTAPSYTNSPASPYTFDTCSISLGGAANANFEALTVTIDNGLEGIPAINGSTNIAKVRRSEAQMIRVAGSIEFSDNTEYQNFLAQTEQAMTIYLTKAASFSCLIELPRVVYSAFDVGMGGRERQVVDVEGIARYHTGSAVAMAITITSTKSFY